MRTLISLLLVLLFPVVALAQARAVATLRVTVVDPSGAVIVGAQVRVTPSALRPAQGERDGGVSLDTGSRGDAAFTALDAGRYTIHVESPGFEPNDARDVRIRTGDNRREVKLAIAKLAETVQVGRDPRERASDAGSDAFTTVLGQAQIDELPDDPDEMEQQLRDMAGPGAVLRVNGFRGGKLPSKDQIQSIRFHRNMFAADAHEPGFMSVDITTKPGLDHWRGSTTLGFRDAALNARNVFAPVKDDERHKRGGLSVNGPLWKQHTSLSLSVDGVSAFDTKTIVAALPSGYFADSIRKPNDALNVTARLEHMLSKSLMLRAEVQHNHTVTGNIGVGDFDLADRGYSQNRTEDVLRASVVGSVGKTRFNEMRLQWRSEDLAFTPVSTAPAVLVLNAFDAGGAQLAGSRATNQVTLTDDLDIAIGRHAIRTGFQLDAGRYRSNELRNTTGTFTFSSLAAYAAGLPTTFTRNVGNADVAITQVEAALYVQDDVRVRKDLTLSGGIRQEVQSHIGGLHLAPRGGVVWSPFKSGKTTVRGGGGVFFDWFDAQSYEQAAQLDGTHQQIDTIVQPGYPSPTLGGRALVLPPGRVQLAPDLTQPQLREAVIGVEQTLPGEARLNAMYIHRQGSNLLRGVNINAPLVNGQRPDPSAGTVTEIQSTASLQFDALSLNFNFARPPRVFIAANYMFARVIDETDSPFSVPADNVNLTSERGPSLGSSRHRFMSVAQLTLPGRFRLGTSLRLQSAAPYNITTGLDDNGDTISNDRPAGVTRNSGRGRAQADLGIRFSRSMTFGPKAPPPAGPQVRIVRGDSADPLANMSGDGPQAKRFGVEMYVQAYNLLNHTNAINFSGVVTSPFFGQATSAGAPRRVEIGTRVTF